MMRTLFRLFSGGWTTLAERYPATGPPVGEIHTGQHLQVGAVRWRFCVTVCAMPEGLYLAVQPRQKLARAVGLGKDQPALLIPWSELRENGRAMLYWQQAARFSVGEPPVGTILLMARIVESFRGYLR